MVCEIKYIKRNYLRFNAYGNLTKPIYDAWAHIVGYYRFNSITYQRFAVDLWGNICDVLSRRRKSLVYDLTLAKILPYTNLNHSCPYDGHVFVKVDNISASLFQLEHLIPSGRYRIDVTMTDGTKTHDMIKGSLYLSVSDSRVERF